MDDEYYKSVHKTPSKMKEIIKIQGERLKALNQENRALKKDQLASYREIIYFKNQSKKKQNKIDEVIDYCNNNEEFNFITNDILEILKGDDK